MRKKSLRDERSHYGSEKEMLPTRQLAGPEKVTNTGDKSKHGLEMQAGSPGLSGRGEDLNK